MELPNHSTLTTFTVSWDQKVSKTYLRKQDGITLEIFASEINHKTPPAVEHVLQIFLREGILVVASQMLNLVIDTHG